MRKKVKEKISSFSKKNTFDLEFWRHATPNTKFCCLWLMVKDIYKLKGKDGVKLRLQRNIEHIKKI